MNIICGNCGDHHQSVADVRDCYAGDAEQRAIEEADRLMELAHERAIERSHEWAASS